MLLSSTNLNSSSGWVPVATNVFDLTGTWQYNDLQVTNYPQRFYRLELLQ